MAVGLLTGGCSLFKQRRVAAPKATTTQSPRPPSTPAATKPASTTAPPTTLPTSSTVPLPGPGRGGPPPPPESSTAAPSTLQPGTPEQRDDGNTYPGTPTERPLPNDERSRSEASSTAERAVRAYLNRTAPPQQWLDELRPFVTPQYAFELEGTRPSKIPALTVTGPPRALAAETDRIARLQFPTNGGPILATLARSPEEPRWLVARMQLPEQRVG